jgi:nucleotide-binding universal stress UspA family protein
MYRPIIVGLALREDDAAPISLARALARLTGAPLTLATVVPVEAEFPATTAEYALAMNDSAKHHLEAAAAPLRAEHEVSIAVCPGSRVGALHDLAQHTGAIAIVVGSSHRGGVGRVLAGDVAAGLLHGSPCMVVVAPRGGGEHPVTIARVGVAFREGDEGRAALDAAAAIALRTDASLQVLTVVEPQAYPGTYAGLAWAVPSIEARDARHEHAAAAAEAAVRRLDPRLRVDTRTLDGTAVDALARVSEHFDLLVCGSRGFGAFRGVIAGSVSRGLAHRAACPLMLVPRALAGDSAAPWHAGDATAATA